MPSLKALRGRINSVKNTRKITSAMKMVAAAKLRRAQAQAEAARPFAERMQAMLAAVAASVAGLPDAPQMLVGNGRDQVHLLIVVTADRGLAGAFNTNVGKLARNKTRELEAAGKTVKIVTVGRKGRDYLRRELSSRIVHEVSYAGVKQVGFSDVHALAERVTSMLAGQEFDVCTLIYNKFVSVIAQEPMALRIIPTPVPEQKATEGAQPIYEFEPDEETILRKLLPQNLAMQLYRALLESAAGEHGARMTAMDNATRNAGDMISKLTQTYNRSRQANITKELIEIISGAEAV